MKFFINSLPLIFLLLRFFVYNINCFCEEETKLSDVDITSHVASSNLSFNLYDKLVSGIDTDKTLVM